MSADVLKGLLNLLTELDSNNSKESNDLKSFVYSCFGLLSKRIPLIFSKELNLVSLFFSQLGTADHSILSSIQECLLMMCPSFKQSSPEDLAQLSNLLLTIVTNPQVIERLHDFIV